MDSYAKDRHLGHKGFVTDLSTTELPSLERDPEEAKPRFEPLEVQLRFEVGSLVDTQVLIDTDGPRETHWDFVRQEQGRFQVSSEETNIFLSHNKQDESFNNCKSWPRSAGQVDTRILINTQDNAKTITEAFAGKDKSVIDVIEDDRGLLVPSISRQCKEKSPWSGEDKQASEERTLELSRDNDIRNAMEVSQKFFDKLNDRVDEKNSNEYGEVLQTLVNAHEANIKTQQPAADAIEELHLSPRQSHAVEAALANVRAVSKPQSIVAVVSSEEKHQNQEGLLQCTKRCPTDSSRDFVETSHLILSNVAVLEEPEKGERVDSMKDIALPTDNKGILSDSDGKSKMDISSSKKSLEPILVERIFPTLSDLPGNEGDYYLSRRTALAEKFQELSPKAGSRPSGLSAETSTVTDIGKGFGIREESHVDNMNEDSSVEHESVPDGLEEQNSLTITSTGLSLKKPEAVAIGTEIVPFWTDNMPVCESSQMTTVLSILEASTTNVSVVGKFVTTHEGTKVCDPNNKPGRETADANRHIGSVLPLSELPQNSLSAVTKTAAVVAEVDGVCPAENVVEHSGSYEENAQKLESNNSATGLKKEELMQMTSTTVNLSLTDSGPMNTEINKGELPASKEQYMLIRDDDSSVTDNRVLYDHAIGTFLDPQHSNPSTSKFSIKDPPSKESLEKQMGQQDDFREGAAANSTSRPLPQEQQKVERNTSDGNALAFSRYSAKVCPSNESKASADTSQPGGILHVLLDVHRESIADDCLPKNALAQGHLTTTGCEGSPDARVSISSDTTGQEYAIGGAKGSVEGSDSHFSGSGAQVTHESLLQDLSPLLESSGKRKTDLSIRNNRLKDSARASPIQVRADEEQRSSGLEVSGRRKPTPKSMSHKRAIESIENLESPKIPGPKVPSGRKRMLSPLVQDLGKDAYQTPMSAGKTVIPGILRHNVSSDMNGSDLTVPLSSQPFNEPQQVQLRAQILVYGSLIQGAAPEEALMVAAFSNVGGAGHIGRDCELSDRAAWEKQWQAAVDRIHPKSSRESFVSRSNSALVSNSPITTAKAAESGSKSTGSPGMVTNVIDSNRSAGQLARPLDVSCTKGQAARARQPSDSVQDVYVGSRQPVVAATSLGSVTSTALRAVSASPSDSFYQQPKSRPDFQQVAAQTYFPTPSLGPFMTGAPQWFSPTAFPGAWMPQNQTNAYANPSLFTHSQAAASLDQTSEMRRSTPPSSGAVIPASTFSTTLFTPVPGSMSITPIPTADPSSMKQTTSESRPRKRKKTQVESYGSPTDVNLSSAIGSTLAVTASATSTHSLMLTGQACPGVTDSVHLPLPAAPEALSVVVVASTQFATSNQDTSPVPIPSNKALVPCSSNMTTTAGLALNRNFPKNLIYSEKSADHISQAQASAEEAASAAASALRESELLWGQLKAQKGSGTISDTESQLVSSAIAVATAASVAKAAAAAAKAAYEAAAQAKRISEGVLEIGKHASEPPRLLGDEAEAISQAWGVPESFNSILTAAKVASKQRLEAVSAARARAENFESVVRAAELAANAVTQVGSVMAMGETVPFTLDMLLEAGPEGLLRLEDKTKPKVKSTALRSPHTMGTPKSLDREKKFLFKIGSNEAASQKDTQLDSWTSDTINIARPENDMRINTEMGLGLVNDFNKQKATDHLGLSSPTSKQSPLTARVEGGMMEKEILVADNRIVKGALVEVMSDEKGLRGVWFSARVQSLDEERVFVLYDDLLADDGYSPLEEWIQLKGLSGKAPRVRLAHPNTHIGFEGTRKRRREAMGSHKWSVGDRVDAWIRDGWWEGEVKEIIEDGESKAKIFFPGDGDTSIVKTSKLRPSLVWSNGHWVLWNDAKQMKKESSRARSDLHEGETPFAKRQKTEKSQQTISKQNLNSGSSVDVSASHMEVNPFDSNTVSLSIDFKELGADGMSKPRHQGTKVVFGVPRPTKKRKLIEVGRHFGSSRVLGANTFEGKTANNKSENVLAFAPGPSDPSRIDVSKAKRRVFQPPKVRSQKETSADIKSIGKREKAVLSSKTVERNNTLSKDALTMLSKNKEGKPMKKRNILSENIQLESQERSGVRSVSAVVETNITSVAGVAIGDESSLAMQGNPKSNDTLHESGRDPCQAAHMSDGNQTSTNRLPSKERVKQFAQQPKDGDILSSAPITGKEADSHSSKKKDSIPAKGNEEAVRKGTESQQNHEGEKKSDQSGKKQTASQLSIVEKQSLYAAKELDKNKDIGRPVSETWEPRRTSRKIQPTSKLLEGLQTAPKLGKNTSFHDRGHRGASKAPPQA